MVLLAFTQKKIDEKILLLTQRCIVTAIHLKKGAYIQNLHFQTYCQHIKIEINLYQNINDMFQAAYVVFLIINVLYKAASCFDSLYAVRTNEYPKTSCQKYANIETDGRCLGTCGITKDIIVMISHDETTKTCMCCSDITGSDITGPNWKSFVPCKYFLALFLN